MFLATLPVCVTAQKPKCLTRTADCRTPPQPLYNPSNNHLLSSTFRASQVSHLKILYKAHLRSPSRSKYSTIRAASRSGYTFTQRDTVLRPQCRLATPPHTRHTQTRTHATHTHAGTLAYTHIRTRITKLYALSTPTKYSHLIQT